MTRILAPALLVAASAALADPAAQAGAPAAEAPAPKRPLAALPYTPGLDVSAMDRTADPCVDFFAYACGGWKKANPIPADQAAWSVYAKLQDENEQFLWGILEEAARLPDAQRTPAQRRVGDYFAACLDEGAVEAAGARPLAKDLAAISALRSKADLAGLLGGLDPSLADGLVFGFGSEQDYANTDAVIGLLAASGLYTVVDDVKINSKLTLGEDLADLAGLLLARDAWKLATGGRTVEPREGLTPEQRFFVGYAQWACGEVRPEALRVRAATDPHSPYWARVNGLVVNVPEFREAFSCTVGQPMAPRAEVCRIW